MGKGARNRKARKEASWPGLGGRNPLTLPADRFEALVGRAAEQVVREGIDGSRLSLAACWLTGNQLLGEVAEQRSAPWVDELSPAGVALLGGLGELPPGGGTLESFEGLADRWFAQLDAAGTNDRIRAFTDGWEQLARHDNPHGYSLDAAFLLLLADTPLALEALPQRLMPGVLLGADPDLDAGHAYLGASRRIPGATGTTLHLGERAASALGPVFERLAASGRELGLGPDASFGEVLEASGHDPDPATLLRELAAAADTVDPAYGYAVLATDGLLLTAENQALVSSSDRERWLDAAAAYRTVFEALEELADLPPRDPAAATFDERIEAEIEGACALLDELVAALDDGAMAAYRRLVAEVTAHREGHELIGSLGSNAYSELAAEITAESFTGARAEDVRRLAAVRFVDDDPTLPAALDRALAVSASLTDGDLPLLEAVDDEAQALHVWVVLLAVWRAGR